MNACTLYMLHFTIVTIVFLIFGSSIQVFWCIWVLILFANK